MLTLIGLILFLILGMLFIGFIGNVIAGAAGLIVLFVRFPIATGVTAFIVWLIWTGNLKVVQ